MLELLLAVVMHARADEPRAHLHASVGAAYDSNILVAPDSMFDQGTPTDFADYRVITNGDLSYHAYVNGRHRADLFALAALINTAQNIHAAGDPYRLLISAPYHLNRDVAHPWRLTVTPAYQSLIMDPTLTSRKSVVQNSALLTINNNWRTSARTDVGVTLEYRRDDAQMRQSVGNFDADANKYSAKLNLGFTPEANRRWGVDAGVIQNDAAGRFIRYQRLDAGVSYEGPAFGDATFNVGLGVYALNFPTPDVARRDQNVHANLGLYVPLDQWFGVTIDAAYARNSGKAEPFRYDRFTVMTALTLDAGL